MTSEEIESYQYLSSSASDGSLSTTTIQKETASNNNNTTTNHFVIPGPDRIFESYPEPGVGRGVERSELTSSTPTRSCNVNNPLSLTSALALDTSSQVRALQSQLVHNNNNTITTKLTGNHLSVKNHRDTIAPYLVNPNTKSRISPPPSQTNMYDSVMVSTLHVNNSSAGPALNRGGGLLIPSANNHIHHHHHKLEPNGNTVDLTLTSSPEPCSSDIMMMTSGGNHSERLSSFGGGNTSNSDSVMMGLLHGNNTSAHLTSGSGGHIMSSHGNGLSLSSPGGSLEDQDCDEEKVINGDTFSPGDVPDPDAIKMFVGQIPKHLSETELKTLFEEFGRVFQINVLRDKVNKQSKGCCFVTFYTRKAALDAQNALHNVKTLPGMNHPIQMKPADNENRYERKLFVGMLSKKCSESDVRTMFARFGHIDECTVLRDPQGTSRGCAFITFASKQCAQSAIKALHHSLTMEGCSSPVVVKFADTQKDKDQKRTQQIHATIIPGFQTQPTSVNAISPQYFTLLQQLQQQQQQQQNNSYFSSLSPLSGIATLASLASPSPGASLTGLTGSHGSGTNSDLAALAALANFTGVGVTSNQHSVALGIQAALAAALNGTHSTLSQDYGYTNSTNGSSSLGSTNSLASTYTGNGLHAAGLSSYTSALRASVSAASKQAEGPEGANLFIYHLPPEATDPDLISMFSPFGTVISAKVYIDKNTNRSKCFGFVSYDNAMSAQLAIQTMNGFQVGMKRLKVQLKRSKEAAKPY